MAEVNDQAGQSLCSQKAVGLARWSLVFAQRPRRKGGNDTHIVPVLPERARGKMKHEGCWPLVLARRARVVKLIVTLWAVLVEARSKRPISLVAERINSKLGRTN